MKFFGGGAGGKCLLPFPDHIPPLETLTKTSRDPCSSLLSWQVNAEDKTIDGWVFRVFNTSFSLAVDVVSYLYGSDSSLRRVEVCPIVQRPVLGELLTELL